MEICPNCNAFVNPSRVLTRCATKLVAPSSIPNAIRMTSQTILTLRKSPVIQVFYGNYMYITLNLPERTVYVILSFANSTHVLCLAMRNYKTLYIVNFIEPHFFLE